MLYCRDALLLLLLLLLDEVIAERGGGGLKDISMTECVSNPVQLGLQPIEIGVQPDLENLVNGAELQFAHQPPGELFRIVAEARVKDTRNSPQCLIQFGAAKAN